jgi:hypothetical protein
MYYFLTYLPIYPSNYLPTQAVPRLRRLVAGFIPRRPGFESRSGHVGFVVDKVALEPLLVILIPPIAPHSSSIVRCWYNWPVSCRRNKCTSLTPPQETKRTYLPTYLPTNLPTKPTIHLPRLNHHPLLSHVHRRSTSSGVFQNYFGLEFDQWNLF